MHSRELPPDPTDPHPGPRAYEEGILDASFGHDLRKAKRGASCEAIAPQTVSKSCFFLHESRRYVCRFCTSHLVRVKKELLYRLHSNSDREPPKQPNTTTQKQQTTKKRKQPVTQLAWPCRHSKER